MTREELEKSFNFVCDERIRLQKENELLREQLKVLKDDIKIAYCDLMALDLITKKENEEIEEL